MHRIGRQKFTKALVCSTGARVTEVDLDHRARADRSRYGVISLVKLALHVLTGFWAQLVQWLGTVARRARYPYGAGGGTLGRRLLDPPRQLPGPAASWEGSCCSCSVCRDS